MFKIKNGLNPEFMQDVFPLRNNHNKVRNNNELLQPNVKTILHEIESTQFEGLSPGRCLMEEQRGPILHPASASRIQRRKWCQNDKMVVMKCYQSELRRNGYRKKCISVGEKKECFLYLNKDDWTRKTTL